MSTNSHQDISEKLTNIFDWLTQKPWQGLPMPSFSSGPTDELSRYSSDAPTRPSRIVRRMELLEPVTEQQKIMDLAG